MPASDVASYAGPLSDPDGASSLVGAALWVEQALLGSVATSIAVMALAWLGFLMMTGRLDFRRAGIAILGCFIIFGAPVIAAGIVGLSSPASLRPPPIAVASTIPPPPPPAAIGSPPDPYAGASVP